MRTGLAFSLRRCVLLAGLAAVGFLIAGRADASPVNPEPQKVEQPDGDTLTVYPWGDGSSHGFETAAGYTLVEDRRGEWVYARRGSDGQLHPTATAPDEGPPPAGTDEHERPDAETSDGAPEAPVEGEATAAPSGGAYTSAPTLVILADFLDTAPRTDETEWAAKFFGATDSVKKYWADNSFGKLAVTPAVESSGIAGNGIIDWVSLNRTHPNSGFTSGVHPTIKDAIAATANVVDYTVFDTDKNNVITPRELHLVVILAGNETAYAGANACAPSVWGHNWSLTTVVPPTVDGVVVGGNGGSYSTFGEMHCSQNAAPGHMATIGIMAHELGHDLGFPDLYDTDASNGSSEGVGEWSVMGSGSWLSTVGEYAGATPAGLDAWSKSYQGWIAPKPLTGTNNGVAIGKADSNAQAVQVLDNANGVDWSFNSASGTGEYFLFENRQNTPGSWDEGLPGCGVLAWHVDETRSAGNDANSVEGRKLVDLEEADGRNDLDNDANRGDAGDPYGIGGGTVFTGSSAPDSNRYSGAASGVSMKVRSSCADVMRVDLSTVASSSSRPAIRVRNVRVKERASGRRAARFKVTLSSASSAPVSFRACTRKRTAVSPRDFHGRCVNITIPGGRGLRTTSVVVYIRGDGRREPKEYFTLRLSRPVNATIADGTARGTIIDN